MTGLYIFATVLSVILLLLFSPIRLSLRFESALTVRIRYLFLRFSLYPKEKRIRLSDYTPRKIRKRRKKAIKKRRIAKQKAALKEPKKKPKRTLKQNLRLVRLLLTILKDVYRDILNAVHIRVRRFKVTVATEDAAKTAILYGTAAQSTAYLLEALRNFTKTRISYKNVDVVADFTASESVLAVDLSFWTTPFSLCALGIKAFFLFLTQKNTDKNKTGVEKDERKQSQ